MKKLLIVLASLLSLSAFAAPVLVACGNHASEKRFPDLDWSRVTRVDVTSFAGNVSINICAGVNRQTLRISRIVMRDAGGTINVQESIAGLARFKQLVHQSELPLSARTLVRPGPLMSMKVTGTGPGYQAEIRLHRKLGRLGGTDIRAVHLQVAINHSADAEARFNNAPFDGLNVRLQTVGAIMLKEAVITSASQRSSRELQTSSLPTVSSLGI